MNYIIKSSKDACYSEMGLISPHLGIVFNVLSGYADKLGLPVVITCITKDVKGRKSETHSDGRAIDISLNGWNKKHQYDIIRLLNRLYGEGWGTKAVNSPNKPRVIIVHGEVPHFHMQVIKELSLGDLISLIEPS